MTLTNTTLKLNQMLIMNKIVNINQFLTTNSDFIPFAFLFRTLCEFETDEI